MNEAIHIFHTATLTVCVALLAAAGTIYACKLSARSWAVMRGHLTGWRLTVFGGLAMAAVVAAQKHNVAFPRTDPTISYLTDRGSYSTEDSVYVDFSRIIAPDTATWYLDYRLRESTDDADWTTFHTGTFGEYPPPLEFSFANATNYNWVFYTDWTPGPSVVTNGVWHAFWGRDQRRREFYIPIHTAVRVNGETIATPKSKEDNRE